MAASSRFRFLFGAGAIRKVMDEASRHRNTAHVLRAETDRRKDSG